MHIHISLGTKYQLKLAILIFWTKFTQQRYCRSKTENVSITVVHIRISVSTNFQLKLSFLIISFKFTRKGSKTEKGNITIEFCILDFVLLPNFSLNWQFCFCFLPNFSKEGVSVQNCKFTSLPMIASYYIKLSCTGADRYNGICDKTRQSCVRCLLIISVRVRRLGALERKLVSIIHKVHRCEGTQSPHFNRLLFERSSSLADNGN